jgi:ABC-type phosphate transport system substrate-binding protein
MSMKSRILIWVLLSSLILPGVSWAEEIAVIVNGNNDVGKLSMSVLSQIYRGRMTSWPNGKEIIAINRSANSQIRKEFYGRVLDSKPTQKFFLPGSPIPFRTVVQRSAEGATKFVQSEPRAIAYVYLSELSGKEEGIRIIKVGGLSRP